MAQNVAEFVQGSWETVELHRAIQKFKPSESILKEIKEKMVASNTFTTLLFET